MWISLAIVMNVHIYVNTVLDLLVFSVLIVLHQPTSLIMPVINHALLQPIMILFLKNVNNACMVVNNVMILLHVMFVQKITIYLMANVFNTALN